MSTNNKKQNNRINRQNQNVNKPEKPKEFVPKNPSKTWWGKVLIIVILLSMILSPVIALIVYLIQNA